MGFLVSNMFIVINVLCFVSFGILFVYQLNSMKTSMREYGRQYSTGLGISSQIGSSLLYHIALMADTSLASYDYFPKLETLDNII